MSLLFELPLGEPGLAADATPFATPYRCRPRTPKPCLVVNAREDPLHTRQREGALSPVGAAPPAAFLAAPLVTSLVLSDQSPQKCPKCSNTENLTVAVTCAPDASATWGGRVDWDNDSATTCGACGFIGEVADFEPKDSYGPENEEEMEKKAAAMYGFDIEGERRREAGFRDEIRRRREAEIRRRGSP